MILFAKLLSKFIIRMTVGKKLFLKKFSRVGINWHRLVFLQTCAYFKSFLKRSSVFPKVCGYPTYAHRATIESLAENPEKINKFLNKLSTQLRQSVKVDYSTMLALKKANNHYAPTLEMWDVPYYTSLAKNSFFQVRTHS